MLKLLNTFVFLLLFAGVARAQDGFEGVACNADIAKALVGKKMSNEPVAAIEGRHKSLGLKDLGGDEISDRLNTISWQICGSEYMLLVDNRSIVRDVLAVSPHSKSAPEFIGRCQAAGKDQLGVIVAVLDGKTGAQFLPAQAAWKIDEKQLKFSKIATEGLLCPRSGISTADGGG